MNEVNESVSIKLEEVYEKLKSVGFSEEQAKRLILNRTKHTKSKVPFLATDVEKRFSAFQTLFEKYEISSERTREILSHGLIFSHYPTVFENLLDEVEKMGFSSSVFLNSLSSTEHGLKILSHAPLTIKKHFVEMANNFSKYGLTGSDCCEMVIKYPYLLKMKPETLVNKLNSVSLILQEHGVAVEDWLKVAKNTPDILVKNTDLFVKKSEEMIPFLETFGIKSTEWVDAYLRFPRLLCKSTKTLKQNILSYVDMFEKDLFIFKNNPDANKTYLVRYLLASPQYICVSPDNVRLREQYSRFLIAKGKQPTSAIIYTSKSKILAQMRED